MLTYLKRLFDSVILGPASEPTEHPTGVSSPVISVGVAGTVSPVTMPVPSPTPVAIPVAVSVPTPVATSVDRLRTVGPTVAIVNVSSVIGDAQVSALVAALQIQLDRDFAPAWKMTANLMMIPTGAPVPSDTWALYIMDTTDQAGALGYHDLTPEGNPLGKVFAKDDATYGLSWSVTVSHELLEMLADPYIQNTVFSQVTNTTGTLYALEVADACLTGDTIVPLLNGTSCRIDELVGRDEFFVYSTDSNGSIKPGRGHSARRTRCNTEIVEVTLDNGKTFKCTPDHLIMCRDGSYKMASELCPGESLMPLYRRNHPIKKDKPDYEQVFNNDTSQWTFTHRIVETRRFNNSTIHHKDFNRYNNSPLNLEVMTWKDHRKLHQDNVWLLNASHKGMSRPELCVPHNVTVAERKLSGERGRQQLLIYNGSEAHLNAIRGNQNLKGQWGNETFRAAHAASSSTRMTAINNTPEHRQMLQAVFQTPEFKQAASLNAMTQNHKRWHLARSKPSPHCMLCVEQEVINHKVVSVSQQARADVYDMTVDQYHNFAVDAGVFVHNCEDDSYGYLINGILVSDFVYPTWFESFRATNSTQFDHMSVINTPLQLAKGGYIGVFAIPSITGWTQRLADTVPARLKLRGTYARANRRGATLVN
jgi:hypothetical protein